MHQSLGGVHAAQLAVEQDAWNAALARARGERILDDPKLLSRCAIVTRLSALPMQAAAQLGVKSLSAASSAWVLPMPHIVPCVNDQSW